MKKALLEPSSGKLLKPFCCINLSSFNTRHTSRLKECPHLLNEILATCVLTLLQTAKVKPTWKKIILNRINTC